MDKIANLRTEIKQVEGCPTLWQLTSPDMRGLLIIARSSDECREDALAVIPAMRAELEEVNRGS